ncbi:MarR family winged helix-turn-helix transcriptional regulator [Paracidobacterium acidisoli]|uniref:MarR family transcriptional regulator n=1 Tax=Paracidobacterium acidisoli TaxID=2303751 RepID=A0A372IPC4_9BACT|nr:MarR family transcriptional regulator [Paracidobacterium acidisoli]MBT9331036.1 MarR family transcriptional regulator [Paracidobacterium acidisoli]
MKPLIDNEIIQDLAWFRYSLRKFLRFSENAARECGVTPQRHQLMLGIAGFTGTGKATISELAEFLQEKNNSVVGLVDRAVQSGLVRRESSESDRRLVVVSLTSQGEKILSRLALLHQEEVRRVRAGSLNPQKRKSQLAAGHAATDVAGRPALSKPAHRLKNFTREKEDRK